MAGGDAPSSPDWARYWRAGALPVEAMHAHFTSHVYHRHSHESYSFGVTAADLTAGDLAAAAGCSRYAAYRACHQAYGLAPSDYQRQLRVRAPRRLLSRGVPLAVAAAEARFADQAHLTRWFRRYYGITPALTEAPSARRKVPMSASTIANLGTLILAVATFSAVGRLLTDFAASPLVLSHPVHHN